MMKNSLLFFLCGITCSLFAQDTFRLAPPVLKYGAVFFAGKTDMAIKFAQSGTAVHYTLNGNEPTSKDPKYKKPIAITNNFTTVKAKAFGKEFRSSETVAVTFIKDGKPIQSIIQTPANAKYPGSGATTLMDNKGGIEQSNSNTWMGYNCDTVTIQLNFAKPQQVNKILLDFLQNEGGWIFLPEKIEVSWFDRSQNSFQKFGSIEFDSDKETPGSHCVYKIIETKEKFSTSVIAINILVKKNMPAWHSAKGEHAWMFINEIKVY
jgi:hypothetical protein